MNDAPDVGGYRCDTTSEVGYKDVETRSTAYTALDSDCESTLSHPDAYISPEWFVTTPLH
jgi:hypothetical protein